VAHRRALSACAERSISWWFFAACLPAVLAYSWFLPGMHPLDRAVSELGPRAPNRAALPAVGSSWPPPSSTSWPAFSLAIAPTGAVGPLGDRRPAGRAIRASGSERRICRHRVVRRPAPVRAALDHAARVSGDRAGRRARVAPGPPRPIRTVPDTDRWYRFPGPDKESSAPDLDVPAPADYAIGLSGGGRGVRRPSAPVFCRR
jgi:hypothetical protein